VLRSEEFDNAYWSKDNITVSENTSTAPDNTTTADTITADANNSGHDANRLISVTSGVTYSLSCHFKKGTTRYAYIGSASTGWNFTAILDLDTGLISDLTAGATTNVVLINGFYRVTISATATSTISVRVRFGLTSSATSRVSNLTTSDTIIVWGAQFEVGAYPTSYIKTTTATVTRIADAASKTGISDLIGGTEGTLMLDVDYKNITSSAAFVFGANNSTGNVLGFAATAFNDLRVKVNSVNDIIASVDTSLRHKVALAFNASGVVCYVNGSPITLPNGGSEVVSGLDKFILQTSTLYNELNVYQVYYSQTRLSNTELAQITTL
jgi:hypothetical protein